MNKIKSLVLAAIGWLCSMSVSAEDFEVDGIYYNILSSTDMTVEVTYRGLYDDNYSNEEYSGDITIPESVTYNGNTFSVTSIGDNAFDWCTSLTSVEIPNSVTRVGNKAFWNCSSLTSVEIPNSVTSIEDGAFEGCSGLVSVVIGNSVTSIGFSAFLGCSSLTSVEIPNSVTRVGERAFIGCSGLISVEIPNSVTSIGSSAFSDCSGLTSIAVAEDNPTYDSRNNCNAIIETQTNTLIAGCRETTIPNSVTSIGYEAFRGCSGLTSLEIPNSVTSIEYAAIWGCGDLTSVEIPNSVTSIGDWAFAACSGLTSVVIGNSVTSIGHGPFADCFSLKSITSLNSTPPVTTDISPFSNYDATLYVPFGAKDAYSKTMYWKDFTNIEELALSPDEHYEHYELKDGVVYDRSSNCFVDRVTYTRTLPNLHWNALYVPFELPYDVIADRYDVAYINDVNGYDTDDNGTIDDLAMEIIKIKGGTLKANYPYLIKAKTAADKVLSITVEDATLYAAEENSVDCSSVYQNYTVTGIYTKMTAEELAGMLAISTSGAWQPLAAGTALNPFRLYLSIENRDNSPLKVETVAMSRMRIVERGETTGVETIIPAQQREDVIIDLSGRRVKQPVKGGLYIVNGKKRIF
ncbi:MAG: leucine-rich repeat domain-containing protein [Bacteroidaceae bacterium]|nr:leucine-rich repeat domain-containing protein [Bacteroidaceae bacterium]